MNVDPSKAAIPGARPPRRCRSSPRRLDPAARPRGGDLDDAASRTARARAAVAERRARPRLGAGAGDRGDPGDRHAAGLVGDRRPTTRSPHGRPDGVPAQAAGQHRHRARPAGAWCSATDHRWVRILAPLVYARLGARPGPGAGDGLDDQRLALLADRWAGCRSSRPSSPSSRSWSGWRCWSPSAPRARGERQVGTVEVVGMLAIAGRARRC